MTLTANQMTPQIAKAIYDILVEHAGASEDYWREHFVHAQTADDICIEYRFQGDLGFGGKFYREGYQHTPWRVTAYVEDEKRPGVLDKINATNAALAALQAEHPDVV